MPNWAIIGSILTPNIGGWASAITMAGQVKRPDGKAWYQTLKKPNWTPPNWVFGPAWTGLYSGMGYASYMVYRDCGGFNDESVYPLALYGTQLFFNWTWTPIFFRFHLLGLAFWHIAALDFVALQTTVLFAIVNKKTLYFMLPYLGWLGYASYLNYWIWKENKKSDDDVEKILDK